MGCVMGQGTVSLPEWNLDINRVQFIGTGVHLYYHEGQPRGRNYLYWKKIYGFNVDRYTRLLKEIIQEEVDNACREELVFE